ncbi:unnamed protein product [Rotaria sp. Silwood1]|nr:unnamed protein product [Rotaria sp. Silwood1]
MSMTSTTNSVKQRKLNDLRVVDLQRELRSFNISYDKKELKGSLVEKLRQALLNRNLDPDNYLFDTSTDLKSISSDDNNRSHEENSFHDTNSSETSTMEVDTKQQLNTENPVQTTTTTTPPSSSPSPMKISTTTSLTKDIDDEQNDQTNHMDTIDLKQIVDNCDNNNKDLTIEQLLTNQEDENTNDKIDHGLIQVSCSSSDEELDTNNQIGQSTNKKNFNHNTESIPPTPTTATQQQTSFEHSNGEDEQHTSTTTTTTTTDLSTENDNLSKSETNRQELSDEQQKKDNTNKSNKDDCYLWVSNIAKETHASDLKALFSKYGKVLTTKVIGSSSSQWFGYIHLATREDVEKCIQALHQTELHGKKIYVDRQQQLHRILHFNFTRIVLIGFLKKFDNIYEQSHEMHDQTSDSSSSKSKSNSRSTSSNRQISSRDTSSSAQKKRSDQSSHKSSTNDSYKNRDSIIDNQDKPSTVETNVSSKKRSASTSNENKKKLSTSDINKANNDDITVKSYETDSLNKKPNESYNEKQRTSSSSSNSQSTKYHISRADVPKTSEKLESSHKSTTNDRKNDKHSNRSEKSSTHSTYISKSKASSSPVTRRSHSSEKHYIPSTTKPDHHRSSSIDKSKQHTSSYMISNKYDKPKEPYLKDTTYHSTSSKTFDTDRRSTYQNEERLRHEKELLVRKQYVQHQEEENIKEQQRRLADERARMRREFEILERERLEIERKRLALEKDKQDQARELEKQQRRLVDEAKHRQQQQQQAEAKLRDEKLHRMSTHNDNKRPRSSHHEPQRSHHTNTNNINNSNKGYDHRISTNTTSGRGRDRSLDDTNRDYYPEPKRPYTKNQREPMFRDRVVYRESDHPPSTSSLGLSSLSSINSSNNNQRYISSSSNQHRLSDPYNTLPQRGRDMALPPTSSVSTAYERSSRNVASPPNNTNAILRRPHSRERFDDREYIQQAPRRDRSPPTNNTLRRESMETTHWERPKPRDTTHYADDTHKYLPTQYISDTSQSAQQQQQQGLWSAAPPSRQQHHHPDLPVKTASHAPVVDPYGWPHVSQQVPPPSLPSHHPQGLSSSHDRSRANVASNQRIPILPSNQPPPPPPPSSRGSATSQTHLYSHPGIPVNALPTSQQHAPLAPPPTSLHHTTAYVTQQVPPTGGLVLHPTGQPRAYEQHYVVTQPLSQRRY